MKKLTTLLAFLAFIPQSKSQGLEAVIVEKYYQTNAADSADAANNGSSTTLHSGSITYRVFLDLKPSYKFLALFGNQDALLNPIHPLVVKTSTDFYNDPTFGQIFPQGNSLTNTKKNTTLIDSYLAVGGVCAGKMAVPKSEDADGSIGNSSGVLTNNPGGLFGAPINSIHVGAQDGLMPGTVTAPSALGLGTDADVFDQTAGNTFSTTNAAISALGGVKGVTSSNMVLIGQFTTNGQLTLQLNVQIKDTLTNLPEVYVPSNADTTLGETLFPSLSYTSPAVTVTTGINSVNISSQPMVFVSPNPNKGIFLLQIRNLKPGSENSYSLYDISGRNIMSKPLVQISEAAVEQIDISDLNQGIYLLKISVNGIITTKKIIKE